jgi:hypothetical protein
VASEARIEGSSPEKAGDQETRGGAALDSADDDNPAVALKREPETGAW